MDQPDILVVGAGAAGLRAAYELSKAGKKVLVLEARTLAGGRIHTITGFAGDTYAELGAEFVHGKLPHTLDLLKEAGITYHKTGGEMWQAENGKLTREDQFIEHWDTLMQKLNELEQDMSIGDFLDANFNGPQYNTMRESVIAFAEGFDTADISRASAFALRDEWQEEDFEAQYRIDKGYSALTDYLAAQIEQHGGTILTSTPVISIEWHTGQVTATAATGKRYTAAKVIIAVPVPILQLDSSHPNFISFSPEIIEQRAAMQKLGMGAVLKILLAFSEPIWRSEQVEQLAGRSLENASFFFSREAIPTWWTQHPVENGLLTGWLGGPKAAAMKDKTDEEILHIAIAALANIFQLAPSYIQKRLVASHIANWTAQPYILGSYGYDTVDSKQARELLSSPVCDTIYFAGESFHIGDMGLVEAALASGKEVAQKILETK